MSKPVKNLMTESYKNRFEGLSGAVVIDIRGIEANENNALRTTLAQKHIRVSIVKNSLAKRAFEGTDMAGLDQILQGSSALVYPTNEQASVVSVARELIEQAKTLQKMEFKGALLDGMLFGPNEIKRLSEYPTKEEAQAQVVQILLSPAQNLVGATQGPARKLASIIKAVQEKLENGEAINKAS